MTFIQQSGVRNRQLYGSSNSNIFSGNIVATLCANLINIGLVTPEIANVTIALFGPPWLRAQAWSHYVTIFTESVCMMHSIYSLEHGIYCRPSHKSRVQTKCQDVTIAHQDSVFLFTYLAHPLCLPWAICFNCLR